MPTNHKEKKNKIMTEIDEFRIYLIQNPTQGLQFMVLDQRPNSE